MTLVHFLKHLLRRHGPLFQFLISLGAPLQCRKFVKKHWRYPKKVAIAAFKRYPRPDYYLLKRSPKISISESHLGVKLVDQTSLYQPNFEVRKNSEPYLALLNVIEKFLLENDIRTILEIGCSSGNFLNLVKLKFPEIQVSGIEGHEFFKDACPVEIRADISILDLREPHRNERKFDLVICLEVGEHIDGNCMEIFIDNIASYCGRYLLMSWSRSFPPKDAPPQHISPMYRWQFRRLMQRWNFKILQRETRELIKISHNEKKFKFWWRESMTLFEMESKS